MTVKNMTKSSVVNSSDVVDFFIDLLSGIMYDRLHITMELFLVDSAKIPRRDWAGGRGGLVIAKWQTMA